MEQYRTENEYVLQQLKRHKEMFLEKLHNIHDKLDPQNSKRSVDVDEDSAVRFIEASVKELHSRLKQRETFIRDFEQ